MFAQFINSKLKEHQSGLGIRAASKKELIYIEKVLKHVEFVHKKVTEYRQQIQPTCFSLRRAFRLRFRSRILKSIERLPLSSAEESDRIR